MQSSHRSHTGRYAQGVRSPGAADSQRIARCADYLQLDFCHDLFLLFCQQRRADYPDTVTKGAGSDTGVFFGKSVAEHHRLYISAQRSQQGFALIGYTARKPDDLREKDVDQICHTDCEIPCIPVYDLLRGGVTLGRSVKRGAVTAKLSYEFVY